MKRIKKLLKKNQHIYRFLLSCYKQSIRIINRVKKIFHADADSIWKERRISPGKSNPDKTFYVIRRRADNVGLFSYVNLIMGHIKYAEEQGYIPVIDMKNYANSYLETKEVKKINSWEFYFEQPTTYTLKEVYKSKDVILSSGGAVNNVETLGVGSDFFNIKIVSEWREFWEKNICINSSTKEYIENLYSKVFNGRRGRVLGILCRGTDYVNLKPKDHPVQPTAEMVINKAEEVMKQGQFSNVYLCTEDANIYNKFKEHFSDRLLFADRMLYHDTGMNYLSNINFNRERNKYLNGLEYLSQIVLLSRCDSLIASRVSGLVGAILFSKGYEDMYIWDLGVYK